MVNSILFIIFRSGRAERKKNSASASAAAGRNTTLSDPAQASVQQQLAIGALLQAAHAKKRNAARVTTGEGSSGTKKVSPSAGGTVPRVCLEWLLDSLTTYTLLPLAGYFVTETSLERFEIGQSCASITAARADQGSLSKAVASKGTNGTASRATEDANGAQIFVNNATPAAIRDISEGKDKFGVKERDGQRSKHTIRRHGPG